MLFLPLVPLALSSGVDTGSFAAPVANISQLNGSLVNYYTFTIIYSITAIDTNTVGTTNVPGQGTVVTAYSVQTYRVEYISTLYLILKAVEPIPDPTSYIHPPSASPALKMFLFAPQYLIGILGGVLFLGGAYYTYQCYRPKRVVPPAPVGGSGNGSSDSLSDDGRGAAAKNIYKQAAGGGNAAAKRPRA
jgi:hypothetical protein